MEYWPTRHEKRNGIDAPQDSSALFLGRTRTTSIGGNIPPPAKPHLFFCLSPQRCVSFSLHAVRSTTSDANPYQPSYGSFTPPTAIVTVRTVAILSPFPACMYLDPIEVVRTRSPPAALVCPSRASSLFRTSLATSPPPRRTPPACIRSLSHSQPAALCFVPRAVLYARKHDDSNKHGKVRRANYRTGNYYISIDSTIRLSYTMIMCNSYHRGRTAYISKRRPSQPPQTSSPDADSAHDERRYYSSGGAGGAGGAGIYRNKETANNAVRVFNISSPTNPNTRMDPLLR